jgi:N-acyl-D-amino-acid deacylase
MPMGMNAGGASTPRCDVVIRNGRIVDGTGSPSYVGDVAIQGGRIVAIGQLGALAPRQTIDAQGLVMAPGFIDMLGQSELSILATPHLPSKIYQGITTEITGEGGSVAPLDDAVAKLDHVTWEHYGIKPTWRTFREYFALLRSQGIGINLASYVGATQVRRVVLGEEDRAPTAAELDLMKSLVREAMRDGAVGLSTALQYPPAPYASTEELVALATEAAKLGGIYASHIRDEGDGIIPALDEAFNIGREAGTRVEIWHLKAAGKTNWGRMGEIVSHIAAAQASGVDVAADTYAYPAAFNSLSATIPPWAHDGGREKLIGRLNDPAMRSRIRREMGTPSREWNNQWLQVAGPEAFILGAVQNPNLHALRGMSIAEIAKLWGRDPIDAIFDLLIEDQAFASVVYFLMAEQDVALCLQQPWVSICTDSQGTSPEGLLGTDHPHPRAFGTFPRILRKYVREAKMLTLEEAIRKFTGLPAQRMGFVDRGVLKVGMWADMVVFDPDTIRDIATYQNPNRISTGMQFVLVNGVPVIEAGRMTNALPGQILVGRHCVS